ncbi:MAG: TAXI family TRAP transporter solute-binding subunit [Kiritimatiellaeota bacterium]|nr:TAXI family TRAP transporter solute-binding subunit [Kiritimatiellota bacterium]
MHRVSNRVSALFRRCRVPVAFLGFFLTASCGRRSATSDRAADGAAGPLPGGVRFVSIGTGGVTGVYYQVGGALMKLMNRECGGRIKTSFQSTGGSVYNINAVLAGDLDFGLAQADRQYQAVHGLAEWKKAGPQRRLRSVCSLYPECVTLVAAEDSGIRRIEDLRGKRVNIGNPGSGQRYNAIQILEAVGIDWKRDLHAEGVKAAESAKLLQDGRIDAFFYTVGHPAGLITEATAGRRPVRFVPITGIEALTAAYPYYARAVVPGGLYPKAINSQDIPTVAVLTVLLTSADEPDGVVYALAKSLFENLEEFRTMHPAFAGLDPKQMVTAGLSAPLHPGALRYYREAGLISEADPGAAGTAAGK